jgi:hypothetical protein
MGERDGKAAHGAGFLVHRFQVLCTNVPWLALSEASTAAGFGTCERNVLRRGAGIGPFLAKALYDRKMY